MKHLSIFLFAASAALFAISLTTWGSNIEYGMIKPLSAIVFIVAFILHVTKGEMPAYDKEQEQILARMAKTSPKVSAGESSGAVGARSVAARSSV